MSTQFPLAVFRRSCCGQLRGPLGTTALTPEEAAAQAHASLGQVYGNIAAKGQALLDRYGPGLNAIANDVQAIAGGDAESIVWATTDTALAAVALVAPVGTIIAAIGKVVFGLIKWLVATYPARQVVCAENAIRELCVAYKGIAGRTVADYDAGMMAVLRDERRFWIGSTHNRSTTSSGWSWANNNENICKPYLPGVIGRQATEGGPIVDTRFCTYMDRGMEGDRLAALEIACRPVRTFKAGIGAPLGNTTWAQWEADPAFPARQQRRDADMTAAVMAGQKIRDNHLLAHGDPKYVGRWGDLCAYYGFWIKLAGLPNESLIEILSKVAQQAPDSLPDGVDPNTYIKLSPDLPGVVCWNDGLVGAYMRFFSWVPPLQKTYAVKALIDEYASRHLGGGSSRFRLPDKTALLQKSSSGLPTVAIVGGVGVAALLAWALLS